MKIVIRASELCYGRASHFAAAILAGFLISFACTSSALGCIALSGDPSSPALISSERALIIWDEVHKIEHFIRQANISTTEPNVGFIVPTPTTPDLVESDAIIFDIIREESAPKRIPEVVYQTPLQMIRDVLGKLTSQRRIFTTISAQLSMALPASASVEVVREQDIANYHAVVLAANDAGALAKWLKDNGYAWNKDAEAWLKPYLETKWKITAFKLNKEPSAQNSSSLSTHAIRMSFSSDRPFFPYSEPRNAEEGKAVGGLGRVLNLAILCSKRMSGKLANGNEWPGELQFSGPMEPPYEPAQILAFAKLDDQKYQLPPLTCLTCFRDSSNPRPGTADLYFSPSADQSPVKKTEIDPSLPKEYRLDFSHPLSDLAALLIILVVACPFVYLLGWISRKPPEEPKMPGTF